MKNFLLLLCVFLLISCEQKKDILKISRLFSDHMVLQRNHENPIWGKSLPNKKLTITISSPDLPHHTLMVMADDEGSWFTKLPKISKKGPHKIQIIAGKAIKEIEDVLFGEVWLCGGQSNMEYTLGMLDKFEEIKNSSNPEIRHFKVPRKIAYSPQDSITGGEWELADSTTSEDFSAVAYFFAKKLHRELDVPIGLISSNWGGTVVESWLSPEAAKKVSYYQAALDKLPQIDIEKEKEAATSRFKNFYTKTTGQEVELGTISWAKAELDDSNWPKMQVPGLWEGQGLKGLDGVVWFRKEVELNAKPALQNSNIYLGKIDDGDSTYFNGVLIGSMDASYNKERVYSIPDSLIKNGKNTIAIKITDTGGGGGFWSPENVMRISIGNQSTTLAGNWKYRVSLEDLSIESPGHGPNGNPTILYNGMIHPIQPYGIKGAIWYQGESNQGRGEEYRKLFPLLIQGWREKWKQDFGFYFVQLANFNSSQAAAWPEIREAQLMTLSVPATGMAVITDIGEADDIHPKNKEDVGRRLALWALSKDYGKELVYSGPLYSSMEIKGKSILLNFDHAETGLQSSDDSGKLYGFEIAGDDQRFYPAKAKIVNQSLLVSSQKVAKPVAVRYAWENNPEKANFYNGAGLPASPFRTDNWPLSSKGVIKEYKISQ
ncbi:MAG: sialate O-acetylesterase [Bacteroidia bacterium]|nr:sialate O-acetylesterase [Bacteroidia bacterium]